MKRAACVLIRRKTETGITEVLAVARRDDHEAFGLPGGKVEPHESSSFAALREMDEEILGLPTPKSVSPVYSAQFGNFWTTTYLVEFKSPVGHFETGDAGPVKWVPWSVLTGPKSPFHEYSACLQKVVGDF